MAESAGSQESTGKEQMRSPVRKGKVLDKIVSVLVGIDRVGPAPPFGEARAFRQGP